MHGGSPRGGDTATGVGSSLASSTASPGGSPHASPHASQLDQIAAQFVVKAGLVVMEARAPWRNAAVSAGYRRGASGSHQPFRGNVSSSDGRPGQRQQGSSSPGTSPSANLLPACALEPRGGGEQAGASLLSTSPSSPSPTSGGHQNASLISGLQFRDRKYQMWFNLHVDKETLARGVPLLEDWRAVPGGSGGRVDAAAGSNELIVEVFATRVPEGSALAARFGLRTAQPEDGTVALLERWRIRVDRRGMEGDAAPDAVAFPQVPVAYKRLTILMRALHAKLRVLPAQRLQKQVMRQRLRRQRATCSAAVATITTSSALDEAPQADDVGLTLRAIGPAAVVEGMWRGARPEDIQAFALEPVPTPRGVVMAEVQFLRECPELEDVLEREAPLVGKRIPASAGVPWPASRQTGIPYPLPDSPPMRSPSPGPAEWLGQSLATVGIAPPLRDTKLLLGVSPPPPPTLHQGSFVPHASPVIDPEDEGDSRVSRAVWTLQRKNAIERDEIIAELHCTPPVPVGLLSSSLGAAHVGEGWEGEDMVTEGDPSRAENEASCSRKPRRPGKASLPADLFGSLRVGEAMMPLPTTANGVTPVPPAPEQVPLPLVRRNSLPTKSVPTMLIFQQPDTPHRPHHDGAGPGQGGGVGGDPTTQVRAHLNVSSPLEQQRQGDDDATLAELKAILNSRNWGGDHSGVRARDAADVLAYLEGECDTMLERLPALE